MDMQDSRRSRFLPMGLHPVFMGVVATVALTAMIITLVPRLAASAAPGPATATASVVPQDASGANDKGIGWIPGNIDEVNDGQGDCYVNFTGNVTGTDASMMHSVYDGLAAEKSENINQYGIKKINWTMPPEYTVAPPLMGIDAEATVDCSLIGSGADGTTGAAGTTTVAMGSQAGVITLPLAGHGVVRPAAVPAWLRGAVGALAGAAMYVAVSAITVATMVALGATLGPGGALASSGLAALAGCIGGATSTAVTLSIAGATTSPLSAVASGVAGCATGSLIGSLPVNRVGPWLADQFGAHVATVGEVAGTQLEAAATEAAVELTPIQQAMQDAISSLGSL